jgi:hypothetical protein
MRRFAKTFHRQLREIGEGERDGNKAKAYQVRQVRADIMKYNLAGGEE